MLEMTLTLTPSDRQYDAIGEWYDLTWTAPNGALLGVVGRVSRLFASPTWTWRAMAPDGEDAISPVPCCPFRSHQDAIADFASTLAGLAAA